MCSRVRMICAVGGLWWLIGCEPEGPTVAASSLVPSAHLEGIRLERWKGGRLESIAHASAATLTQERGAWAVQASSLNARHDGRALEAARVEPPIEISADRFSGRTREGTASFEGSVVLTRGELRLTCERLRVRYAARGGQVERIEAEGRVRIQQGARSGEAERVVYEQATRRVALEGAPVLREGSDEMRGTRILWWLDEDRVACEQCRVRWTPPATELPGMP